MSCHVMSQLTYTVIQTEELQSMSPQRLLCLPHVVMFKLQNGEMDTRGSHREPHIDVSADTNMLFLISLASTDIAER